MITVWQMKIIFFFFIHFGSRIAGKILLNNYHCSMHALTLSCILSKVRKYDTKNQCTILFSDQCTVSDEAFGRFTIERFWDIWLKECKEELNKNDFVDNNSDKIKIKLNRNML